MEYLYPIVSLLTHKKTKGKIMANLQTSSRKMTPVFSKFSSLRKDLEERLDDLEKNGKSLELSTRNRYYALLGELKNKKAQIDNRILELKKASEETKEEFLEGINSSLEDLKEGISSLQAKVKNH